MNKWIKPNKNIYTSGPVWKRDKYQHHIKPTNYLPQGNYKLTTRYHFKIYPVMLLTKIIKLQQWPISILWQHWCKTSKEQQDSTFNKSIKEKSGRKALPQRKQNNAFVRLFTERYRFIVDLKWMNILNIAWKEENFAFGFSPEYSNDVNLDWYSNNTAIYRFYVTRYLNTTKQFSSKEVTL